MRLLAALLALVAVEATEAQVSMPLPVSMEQSFLNPPPPPDPAPAWSPASLRAVPSTAITYAFDGVGDNVAPDGGAHDVYVSTTAERPHVWMRFNATISTPLPAAGHMWIRLQAEQYGNGSPYNCYAMISLGNQFGETHNFWWTTNAGTTGVAWQRVDLNYPQWTGHVDLNVLVIKSGGEAECEVIVECGSTLSDLQPITVPTEGGPETAEFALRTWPNPVRNELNVEFTLDRPEQVTVDVYDVTGRLVLTLHEGLADRIEMTFDASILAPGVYVLRVIGEEGVTTRIFTRGP